MDAEKPFALLCVLVVILALVCCKPKGGPPHDPHDPNDLAPAPLLVGKCKAEPAQYQGGGRWVGVTRCAYDGYWWVCPTGMPESARVCNREQPLPPEASIADTGKAQ